MRRRQAVRTSIRRVACAVVQGDVVNVNPRAATDTEAMHWVVLNIDVVHRTRSENIFQFDEMVWPSR